LLRPVRREVARLSLEKLVQDGRIHPARIEEIVAATSKEMEEQLARIGKDAVVEANLPNLAKPISRDARRLAYRTSYGQNVLKHSLEVAYLSQVIADELAWTAPSPAAPVFSTTSARPWTTTQEGGHPLIGMDSPPIQRVRARLNAALAHHGDQPATTPTP